MSSGRLKRERSFSVSEEKDNKHPKLDENDVSLTTDKLKEKLQRLLGNRLQLMKQIQSLPAKRNSEQELLCDKLKKSLATANQEIEVLEQALNTSDYTGMSHMHNILISKFAILNDTLIMWRPINKDAAKLLEDPVSPHMSKALNVKAKTANAKYGPIAAELPCIANFSKIAELAPLQVEEYTKKNTLALQEAEEKYQQLQPINRNNYRLANELLLMTAITKMVEIEKGSELLPLYYFVNENNEIWWESKSNLPVFAVSQQNGFRFYNDFTKAFDRVQTLSNNYKPLEVKIMAYRQFKLNAQGEVEQNLYPITADYDELASAARKIYPLFLDPTLKQEVDKLASLPEEAHIEAAAQLIMRYERAVKEESRNIIVSPEQPNMGAVNEWERAVKIHLEIETKSATRHGPEVNNPFPEPITEGDYAVHLPDGNVSVLKNENEICDFINKQRAKGFPIPVNPKWGWQVEVLRRKLLIPPVKFNWIEVNADLQQQVDKCQERKKQVSAMFTKLGVADTQDNKMVLLQWIKRAVDTGMEAEITSRLTFSIDNNAERGKSAIADLRKLAENVEDLQRQEERHNTDIIIVELKLKIERLRLEPEIIYSQQLNNSGVSLESLEKTVEESQRRRRIEKRVYELEYKERQQEITMLEAKLAELNKKYKASYSASSVLAVQVEKNTQEMNNKKVITSYHLENTLFSKPRSVPSTTVFYHPSVLK
jgi:hypothetical protein